jgi:hypothetical protein
VFRSRSRWKPKTIVRGSGEKGSLGLLRRAGRLRIFWRTGLERAWRAFPLERAEPETEVGELSLQSEALCLGSQSFEMSQLAGLALNPVDKLSDQYLQERLLTIGVIGDGHGPRQPRLRERIGPAVPPGG